ncbi:vacuolar ATPase assembly integral membrane protein vma21 [Fusarium equiseti]|uniref:Vacuolar ATPase assembly integral membrane protein vma21 n=1 Tax=Fusarium equiseti TaxID=61235 RepID=A0ABQ8RAV5_FUSEQ|nr:vacuolar ATPase assembly integral membrane protein vma21 [Fusarium equiseti]
MATRRIVATEKTFLDKDDPIDETSSTAPAVPSQVIYKLLAFTFAMIVVPIGSYFLTVNTVSLCKPARNSSLAGGLAAVLANVVLVGYIIVAMKEDQSDQLKPESKKDK